MASTAIEAVPVQNQAAAQKLPQKMSHRNRDDKHSRGRQFGGRGGKRKSPMGNRKAGAKPSIGGACTGSSREEELAPQLQNQFDLDDYHISDVIVLQLLVQKGPHDVDAENIKMSMFSYQKEDDRDYERRGRRGRGQGRSRGRGKGGFR
ncbi:hypothetical protein ACFX14_026117 [Malus domestica]